MSHRYLVEITTATECSVIVVADNTKEAKERALTGEGKHTHSLTGEPTVSRTKVIES